MVRLRAAPCVFRVSAALVDTAAMEDAGVALRKMWWLQEPLFTSFLWMRCRNTHVYPPRQTPPNRTKRNIAHSINRSPNNRLNLKPAFA